MNGAPGFALDGRWPGRRALLRQMGSIVLGAAAGSVLAACRPSAQSVSGTATSAPAIPTSAPTVAPGQATVTAPASPPAAVPTTALAPSAAVPSGTLRYASADFANESTDPTNLVSYWAPTLYDTLLTVDGRGNVVGNVAESYSLSPDGLTWTFKIRKGITFHNGEPLTAADVVFSLQRFAAKESTNPWSPYLLKNNETITAPDDGTVIYQARTPEWLLKVPFAAVSIFPKRYIESVGQEAFRAKPIGSGPYKFASWVPRTSIEFEANTDYWGPVKPAWAHIVELLVPEEATRVAQFKRGDVDLIGALSFERLVELHTSGFRLQTVGLPSVVNINFPGTWMTHGPTSDVRVRQAMSYAINRQEMCDTFFKGFARPGGWWYWSEQTWGFDPRQWHADGFDPVRAKQLLHDAEYPDNFSPQTVTLYTNAVNADLLQVVQGYWHNIGLSTDIQVVDSPVWINLSYVRAKSAADKQVGAAMLWMGPSTFNNVYQSGHLFTSSGGRSTGNDPKADQMYQAVLAELDDTKAEQQWQQMMHYGYDTMWVNVELVEVPAYVVVGPNVGAFTYKQHLSLQDAYVGIQHPA